MRHLTFLFLLASLWLTFSCKPQVPDEYLQPNELEDILYDWHIAEAMAEANGEDENGKYNQTYYRQAVLKKYNITQAELDSSLVYYMRHADRLHKIYENISKRLGDEALALGASADEINRYGDMKSAKDTSNLWTGVPACALMTMAPYNVLSFEIEADSSYHKGDKIILSFNSLTVGRDGVKEGVALLAVQFENDSVASNRVRISSNMNYSVTVSDGDMKGIKAIRGFITVMPYNNEERENPLGLMFIDNVRIVRMRGGVVKHPIPTQTDSLTSPAASNSSTQSASQPVRRFIGRPQEIKVR